MGILDIKCAQETCDNNTLEIISWGNAGFKALKEGHEDTFMHLTNGYSSYGDGGFEWFVYMAKLHGITVVDLRDIEYVN